MSDSLSGVMDPRRRRGVPARGGPPDGRAARALPRPRCPRSSPAARPSAHSCRHRPAVPCKGLCTCTAQLAVCTVVEINLIGANRSLRSAGPKNRTPGARTVNFVLHSGADLRKVDSGPRTTPHIRPHRPRRGNSGYRKRLTQASGRHPISPRRGV
ncbi:Uncharacterised protein [Amycolatopsis camponoti]|uniref:Uncharacterized protein n=1 Tax=Amycolatopsis camponoti TaxID=2606593 RepID=A0A6I8LN03_9PSEU|nr:Uncharacterised protein [Amycolatopsis camponoti]